MSAAAARDNFTQVEGLVSSSKLNEQMTNEQAFAKLAHQHALLKEQEAQRKLEQTLLQKR